MSKLKTVVDEMEIQPFMVFWQLFLWDMRLLNKSRVNINKLLEHLFSLLLWENMELWFFLSSGNKFLMYLIFFVSHALQFLYN